MTTDLQSLSDEELSAAFAAEVAQLVRCEKWVPAYHPLAGVQKGECEHNNCHPSQFWPPKFATSADAVLPFLEECAYSACRDYHSGVVTRTAVQIVMPWSGLMVEGRAPTFARAACIALLQAKRAQNPKA